MSNPNHLSSTNVDAQETDWDSLSEVELSPISISTDEISNITVSDSPMGEGRQDKRIDVEDASGIEKRTSNLMLGYNERGVQIGEKYLSIEEFQERALRSLEEDTDDKVLFYIRNDTEKRFAEPRAVVDDMVRAIANAGPEATLGKNTSITNQDARSVEFGGPNGETQRGVFMLGNDGVQLPNGTYAEASTIGSVIDNYAKATKKEAPITPTERPINKPESDTPNKDLHQATLELAELYAKSRRLVAGPGVREEFEAARQEYQQLLTEHLSSLGRSKYSAEFQSFSSDMQTMANELATENIKELTEFVGGDLNHPLKTPEEIETKREELRRSAEARMKEKYPDLVDGLETTVTSEVIEEYTRLRSELQKATIDALDNGTACRKAVNKIITNKWLKGGLLAASAVGLAVAAVGIGQGIADGSMAVSLGYTAGGITAGALRGGLAGALMSRRNSKTSAIRNYDENIAESIKERIQNGEHITAESLAAEAMSDYATANKADLQSNRLKTAISTGAGAFIGAAASGIHIDNVAESTIAERVKIGTTPEHYEVDLSKIDITPGSGIGEAFTDLGGDPSKITQAVEIAHQFDAEFGMVPGSNGVVPGVNGGIGESAHVYPGTVDTWTAEEARKYIAKVAQKWAENGLIVPTRLLPGTPIYSTVEKTVVDYIPNLFYNALVQAEAAIISGNIGGLQIDKKDTP